MGFHSILCFNVISGYARVFESSLIDIGVKDDFLNWKGDTSLLEPMVQPLRLSLLTSKMALRL
jgi:hypothetical protein